LPSAAGSSGYVTMAWASQATTTASIKLNYGFLDGPPGSGSAIASGTIGYSTNSGSTWTTIASDNSNNGTDLTTVSISLPANTNLSTVRIRFCGVRTAGTTLTRATLLGQCWDAYIQYT
jgi:hypothetical protein